MSKVTEKQASAVLEQVAAWMAKHGYGTPICPHGKTLGETHWSRHTDGSDCEGQTFGPAPTGPGAAANGLGPELRMDWDWPSGGPTPTVLLEGGPEEWAYHAAEAVNVPGVYVEPYASYALCIYPA